MTVIHRRLVSIAFITLLAAGTAAAQSTIALPGPQLPRTSPFAGGVPEGVATSEPISINVIQAILRSLQHNLGLMLSEQDTATANADRWTALSRLLPDLSASLTESRRKTNLEAFGFPLGPTFPKVVGPFNVFDARVFASQPIFDLDALNESRAATHAVAAAEHTYRHARSIVMLATANIYLQALASQARAEAARAQLTSAQAIHQQALDLRQGGLVAGLDVVRAEVQVSIHRQRATAAANDAEKSKLQLARIIGLPIGQPFTLVDDIPTVPDRAITIEEAMKTAYDKREDFLAALEDVKAAEARKSAAIASHLPAFRINADFGTIGLTPGSALPTFNVTGALDVPIFDGGRRKGRMATVEAQLRQRRARLEDLRATVYYDVRTAFLDVEATQQQLEAADRGRALATQALEQSRDRFAAGVATNIEVVQAQETLALATEQAISARYGYSVAKALLAQSNGSAEETLMSVLKSTKP
ncbi:MAG TPA: TolC family protein [Vicinamibacterales bacterium]|nr:TolC family protein [Vicinamibacterales bacterium]